MSAAFATVVLQLREQIDEFSQAIEVQKLVLINLMNARSETQAKLNSFLDPMARLPLEIQSEIFLDCKETNVRGLYPDSRRIPLLLLHVCHLWRDIALSTPRLWDAITIDLSRCLDNSHYSQLCADWMDRAPPLPLSITLQRMAEDNVDVDKLIHRYGPRVGELTVLSFRSNDDEYSFSNPHMHSLRIPSIFPMLRTLSVTPIERSFLGSLADWMDLLRAAPHLSKCEFTNLVIPIVQDKMQPFAPLTLAHLRDLKLGTRFHLNTAKILPHVTLPVLETLQIGKFDISEQDFIQFLVRSAPPLRSLALDVPRNTPQAMSNFLLNSLRDMSSLTDLELFDRNYDFDNELDAFGIFIPILGSTESLLPNLQNLTIWHASIKSVECRGLVSALETRFAIRPSRTPLNSFRLLTESEYDLARQFDVLNSDPFFPALRQLMRDGSRTIHVGTRDDNFLARTNEIG
ncbi:hypothetical protein R3P38DRAFT_2960992 [Favolaschia claudopus]|uniref:F-box domain-containing protein n=1 Tax=Favolaschia claudopus TaxID=2862362 RepID=A0AAW0B8X8_9AGAR